MAGEKRRVGNRGRWLRGLERETTRVQRSRSSSSGGGNSQPASQPSCHKLDSTNQRRGCGHRCTFGPFPSYILLLPSVARRFPPFLSWALPRRYLLLRVLFFLGGSAGSPVAAPASQPFNSNQFTLAREPQPLVQAYPRERDQTSRPYPLDPQSLLVPCYHAVAAATRTTLLSLITEHRLIRLSGTLSVAVTG